jgi:hypothetical protein
MLLMHTLLFIDYFTQPKENETKMLKNINLFVVKFVMILK